MNVASYIKSCRSSEFPHSPERAYPPSDRHSAWQLTLGRVSFVRSPHLLFDSAVRSWLKVRCVTECPSFLVAPEQQILSLSSWDCQSSVHFSGTFFLAACPLVLHSGRALLRINSTSFWLAFLSGLGLCFLTWAEFVYNRV